MDFFFFFHLIEKGYMININSKGLYMYKLEPRGICGKKKTIGFFK